MRNEIIKKVHEEKLIVIVRGFQKEEVCFFADAMREGGVKLLEVTFNANDPKSFLETAEIIQAVKERMGTSIFIGAGTVISNELVEIASQAGAEFIISPNVDQSVIEKTRSLGLVSIPGAMTPTEIIQAKDYGADFVKVFPAGDLPVSYIRSVLAPINQIPLLAVGGIDIDNIPLYLKAGISGFGVGGALVNRQLIERRDFGQLVSTAKKMIRLIKEEGVGRG